MLSAKASVASRVSSSMKLRLDRRSSSRLQMAAMPAVAQDQHLVAGFVNVAQQDEMKSADGFRLRRECRESARSCAGERWDRVR